MAIKIGIDCGHGLRTAGKQTPNGVKEWTLNDAVRDKIELILSDYDVELIYVDGGEGATDETLAQRVKTYVEAGVSAFVSIHHNAFTGKWNNATGVEVYVDRNFTARDRQLAEAIYGRLVKYTGLKGRGIKQANFYVINQNKIPAVLVEGGFMDGQSDYKVITSDKGQTAYAQAVAEGLIDFLGLTKLESPQKSVEQLAKEVIAGKWGNGSERKEKLTKAGHDYNAVQSKVNEIVKGSLKAKVEIKTVDELAREVIAGKWGNGDERKKKLTAAGYDYKAIQKRVNELL